MKTPTKRKVSTDSSVMDVLNSGKVILLLGITPTADLKDRINVCKFFQAVLHNYNEIKLEWDKVS